MVGTLPSTTIFHHQCYLQHYHPQTQTKLPLSSSSSSPKLTPIKCALSKQGQRFLTSIATLPFSFDPSPTHRLIHKFVSSSSKSVTLSTLNHLLSPQSTNPRLSSVVLPVSKKKLKF
ncbi:hypothetical protein RDABS01_018678 [Bienertia sinuspersici]